MSAYSPIRTRGCATAEARKRIRTTVVFMNSLYHNARIFTFGGNAPYLPTLPVFLHVSASPRPNPALTPPTAPAGSHPPDPKPHASHEHHAHERYEPPPISTPSPQPQWQIDSPPDPFVRENSCAKDRS